MEGSRLGKMNRHLYKGKIGRNGREISDCTHFYHRFRIFQ